MIKFILCDDNINVLDRLTKILELLIAKHNYPAEIGLATTDYKDFLSYIEINNVDILILDINLKGPVSGLELARKSSRK